MNAERVKEIMEKVGPMSPYSDVSVPSVELFELCMDAMRYYWLKANHLQTGPDSWIRTGDDLEEAIDAGMRSTAAPETTK